MQLCPAFFKNFACTVLLAAISCRAPEPGLVIKIKEEINPHEIFSVFALPEEELDLEVLHTAAVGVARAQAGQLTASGRNQWRYRAPAAPGVSFLEIVVPQTSSTMRVGVWVLVPFAQLQGEYLNRYRIGRYPERTANGHGRQQAPVGFIEVTEANQNILLTPNFQLKQFLCRQEGAFPKYVVLRERLLLALEFILQKVKAAGFKAETLAVLSGYRTPFYNDGLENASLSRHIYGDAADVFIDANHDGRMDDLDDDGDVDRQDVKILYDLIDRLSAREDFLPFTGGLGWYKKTQAHDGFVHIDTRGEKARW